MLLYLIRHGETDGNTQGYFQGWTNDPLNERGRALAALTGRALRGVRFDACLSSPLDRACETAEIILHESDNGGVAVTTDARLKEVCLGDWERKKFRPGEREIDGEQLKLFFRESLPARRLSERGDRRGGMRPHAVPPEGAPPPRRREDDPFGDPRLCRADDAQLSL